MTDRVPFSLCMPYHDNPGMLQRHYDRLAALPDDIKRGIELVVCDDASAEPATYPDRNIGVSVRLFRIPPPHIPWSHRCATNIAVGEARGRWFVVTDIDHVVPRDTWAFLMDPRPNAGFLRTDIAYGFERVNADGTPYKPHPDSWLFHKSLWLQIGGYDERYRGHYGQNHPFMERVRRYSPTTVRLPVPLIRYSRDDIPDASERVLTRKSPEARAAIAALKRKFLTNGTFFADTRGSVKYERVDP